MALDEPKEADLLVQEEGFRLVVDKRLLEETGGLKIDYLTGVFRKGFQIAPMKSESSCGSGCSC
jgi:Fe-S cluster assembly iron-binding protein IscA